jgi:hypothetical protein
VFHGDIADHLQGILGQLGTTPLLAFVDPFGIGLPFDQLVGELLGRDKGPRTSARATTEVLLTFVHAGIYRNGGKLTVPDRGDVSPAQIANATTVVERLDANLGGRWWRPLLGTPDFVERVRVEYLERVRQSAGSGWRYMSVPVSDVQHGETIYDIVLFTQHPEGLWFFNDAVSLGRTVFDRHVNPTFELQPPLWKPDDEWVRAIAGNLRQRLQAGQMVAVLNEIEFVYGETLGYARGMHVKRAAKQLAMEGLNVASCTVENHKLVLRPQAIGATA